MKEELKEELKIIFRIYTTIFISITIFFLMLMNVPYEANESVISHILHLYGAYRENFISIAEFAFKAANRIMLPIILFDAGFIIISGIKNKRKEKYARN